MIITGAAYNTTSHRYEWDDGSTGLSENLTYSGNKACGLMDMATDAMEMKPCDCQLHKEMTACEMQPI